MQSIQKESVSDWTSGVLSSLKVPKSFCVRFAWTYTIVRSSSRHERPKWLSAPKCHLRHRSEHNAEATGPVRGELVERTELKTCVTLVCEDEDELRRVCI